MECAVTNLSCSQSKFDSLVPSGKDIRHVFELNSNCDPVDLDFFCSVFSEDCADTTQQNCALQKLSEMTPSERAIFPLFSGACDAYNHLIINTGLCIGDDFYRAKNQGKIFINLFKAVDYKFLALKVRAEILHTIETLNTYCAFHNLDLSGLAAPSLDTRGLFLNLRCANLTNTTLNNASLMNVDLCHATLAHTIFTDANLTNVDFSHASLFETNLVRTNLTHATLPSMPLKYPLVVTDTVVDDNYNQLSTVLK